MHVPGARFELFCVAMSVRVTPDVGIGTQVQLAGRPGYPVAGRGYYRGYGRAAVGAAAVGAAAYGAYGAYNNCYDAYGHWIETRRAHADGGWLALVTAVALADRTANTGSSVLRLRPAIGIVRH